jgi:oxygen-independent coproporphyrinogen-3 oxidase
MSAPTNTGTSSLELEMRRGGGSAWPNWRPGFLSLDEVLSGWERALSTRGQPGSPSRINAYVSIPWCGSTCAYCMYWKERAPGPEVVSDHAAYLESLLGRYRERLGPVSVSNAYFGGGTPSLLSAADLTRLLEAFVATFRVDNECTFEANPLSMDVEKIRLIARHGVNRISLGLQSLDPDTLARIGRRNPPGDRVRELVENAQENGLHVDIDLIAGLPGQTVASFQADLLAVTSMRPDHVSVYRYQPRRDLPGDPAQFLTFGRVMTPDLLARLRQDGFTVDVPDDGADRMDVYRVRAAEGFVPGGYSCFDDTDTALLGVGTAAYSHIFGHAWFREVTSLDQGVPARQPAFWGTRLDPKDEARTLVLRGLSRDRWVDCDDVLRACGVSVGEILGPHGDDGSAAGVLEWAGSRFRCAPAADSGQRSALIDALLPAGPRESPDRVARDAQAAGQMGRMVPPDVQEGLLRRERLARERAATDVVGEWSILVGLVPGRPGPEGVDVVAREGAVLRLRTAPDPAPLLELVIAPADGRPAFCTSRRFSLGYLSRGAPLSDREKALLATLRQRMARCDS